MTVAVLQESGPERRGEVERTDPREQHVGSAVTASYDVGLI